VAVTDRQPATLVLRFADVGIATYASLRVGFVRATPIAIHCAAQCDQLRAAG
jgi:hypothetical protein